MIIIKNINKSKLFNFYLIEKDYFYIIKKPILKQII